MFYYFVSKYAGFEVLRLCTYFIGYACYVMFC